MSTTADLHDSRAAAPTPLGDGAVARFMRDSPFIRVAAAIALDVLGSSHRSDPATPVENGHVPEIHRLAPASWRTLGGSWAARAVSAKRRSPA